MGAFGYGRSRHPRRRHDVGWGQQIKYSSGTEPPQRKVTADSCDCHHHTYGSQYKVDPRSTLRPADATADDYRALQKRIGTRMHWSHLAQAHALLS
jgi:hypothetical protein